MRKRNILFFSIFLISVLLNASILSAGDATTLSWDPPTTNADGTPLTDLAGYRIYYGTSSGSYPHNIDVGDTTTYMVDDLTEGLTYYFAVTAYDTSMNESDYSNEVSKTIQTQPVQPTLTVNKTGTGTVTAPGINCGSDCTEQYNQGTVVTLTATPATGSTFAGWSGACTGTGTCSISINTNITVTATFNTASYTITATAGAGGSISPSGSVSVNHGASQTFTIAANSGYNVANVLVDGSSVGAVTTYTFTNVNANHSISASWKRSSKAKNNKPRRQR
jgi:fibronectin type 3 domain-containing protein